MNAPACSEGCVFHLSQGTTAVSLTPPTATMNVQRIVRLLARTTPRAGTLVRRHYSAVKLNPERHGMSETSKPGCKCADKKDDVERVTSMGPLERSLRDKINSELHPEKLIVRNDSWKHAHHSGMKGAENTVESHFHVTIVSDAFSDSSLKNALARHRFVFKLLDDEVKRIHGFQVVCKTPAEWAKMQQQTVSRESSAKYFS